MQADGFSLSETVKAVGEALSAIFCRIGFEAAVHGFIVAIIVAGVAAYLSGRQHKYAKPLFMVFAKIAVFCLLLAIPGAICLLNSGQLPAVNSLHLASVGLFGFWGLVTLHLCMEEMNFQWFQSKGEKQI